MDIWVIYRQCVNSESGNIKWIKPIEFCKSNDEARKYARLFDLQTPIDLKDKISHHSYSTYLD